MADQRHRRGGRGNPPIQEECSAHDRGFLPEASWYEAFAVVEIEVTRSGSIDVVAVRGEVDISNVDELNEALRAALLDETTSCLLDLSAVTFMDSSVVHALVRWSNEAQLSEREALAVMTGEHTPATRTLTAVALLDRLPVFSSLEAARIALMEGQRARGERRMEWLTDAQLLTAREDAQDRSDAAQRRLDDASRHLDEIDREEQRRRTD